MKTETCTRLKEDAHFVLTQLAMTVQQCVQGECTRGLETVCNSAAGALPQPHTAVLEGTLPVANAASHAASRSAWHAIGSNARAAP